MPVTYSLATTLDGKVARPDHSFDFLDKYPPEGNEFEQFYAGIDLLVFGRTTYDVCRKLQSDWYYAGKECIVVTSSPLPAPAEGEISRRWEGSIDELAEYLKESGRNTWLIGGPQLALALAPAIDVFELAIVPEIIGPGIPAYPEQFPETSLKLEHHQTFANGMVLLRYERA